VEAKLISPPSYIIFLVCNNLLYYTVVLKFLTCFKHPNHVCLQMFSILTLLFIYTMSDTQKQYFTNGLAIVLYNLKCVLLNITTQMSLSVKCMLCVFRIRSTWAYYTSKMYYN